MHERSEGRIEIFILKIRFFFFCSCVKMVDDDFRYIKMYIK